MAEKGTGKNKKKKPAAKRGRPPKKKELIDKSELLTENQEAFLYYLVYEGLSQREAYRKAYPNCHAKDSVVDVKASQTMRKDKVRVRYRTMLEDVRRRRYYNAATKAPQVEDRLYKIAMGQTKFKGTDLFGKEIDVLPTIPQQTKALAELNKVFNEIMNNAEYEKSTSGDKQVIINIAPFESKEKI